jgi:hypothetical protein
MENKETRTTCSRWSLRDTRTGAMTMSTEGNV